MLNTDYCRDEQMFDPTNVLHMDNMCQKALKSGASPYIPQAQTELGWGSVQLANE
ncbi:hypothetical protein G7B40_015010 [Aetokthonos hydrillicola Thurmond2011]|jgi:hypothetical protein|uniref:Uncharacterized protein n=1 Tax=Aetokthonos hydrillicola Thurmond2011 TaxID=2712845 RepID=A0AAP5MAH1_9CYAN|nr:hypothetical protein [Aetokthonos hydrillicola]MDR9895863.1 hypothetical protein [Aetokthonos hydrillicola Thurmond2011]